MPKTKKCACCGSEFSPYLSTDKACSPSCARALEKLKTRAKKAPEKSSKAKKKKRDTVAKLSEKAAVLLQKLVRLKASDDNGICECVTCGKRDHYKKMQGGHFIQRTVGNTKLMEENIHPQCPYCNQHGMKTATGVLDYRRFMVEMYGESFVQELEQAKHKPHKWNRLELEDMIVELKQRVKEQEARF